MAEPWFVENADGKVEGPFHERQISANLLAGKISDTLRIRQGVSGPWCPAARARAVFQQLADEGWYVRALDETFGPFMPEKLLELSRSGELHPDAEVRQGTSNQWKPAERVLSLWRAQKVPSTAESPAVGSAEVASAATAINAASSPNRSKWSTEPIRHYRLALESTTASHDSCRMYERLLLATDDSRPDSLAVNRANGEQLGSLSPANSQQLKLNCQRGASHVVLFLEATVPEVVIIICPPGTIAEDCSRYIEENFREAPVQDGGFPNIKI